MGSVQNNMQFAGYPKSYLYSLQINKTPTRNFSLSTITINLGYSLYIILLKSDTIPGIVYNVHCSPSTNIDVGKSASVKADAVVESPKKHKNVLITELNLIAINLANYHVIQAFFSFLGEFLCFNGIFLCNGIANVIFVFSFKFKCACATTG